MTQKRPKITVTESNREFVIPTLEKLGGVNTFELNGTIISEGDILYINLIGSHLIRDRSGATNKSMFYEVDPKDYVKPFDPTEIPLTDKEITSLLGDKISLANTDVYAENQRLQSENKELRNVMVNLVMALDTIHIFREEQKVNVPTFYHSVERAKQLLNK